MKIGAYDIQPIETGRFALDGGAMFGVVPRVLWEKSNPPDEQNRITMAARALLLSGEGRRILVDTGNGEKMNEKLAGIYKLDSTQYSVRSSLARIGLVPEDITDVLLTHLHFDHAGGSTEKSPEGIRPAFPNAVYHVQQAHWDAAMAPTERDKASFMPEDFLPLQTLGRLRFVDGECELFRGITLRLLNGHTRALQVPLVSDGTTSLLFCADLIPLSAHVTLPWIMAYDLRPLVTLEEKRKILSEAAEKDWILFFEHDPLIGAARVRRTEKGFTVSATMQL